MKAEELMIGNIIKIDNIKQVGIVEKVTTLDFSEYDIGDDYVVTVKIDRYYDCLENEIYPIEITAPLLKAIGFDKEPDDFLGYQTLNWFSIDEEEYHVSLRNGLSNHYDRNWTVSVDNKDFETIANCDIQYLHQLQNILTIAGINLNIKLEDVLCQ